MKSKYRSSVSDGNLAATVGRVAGVKGTVHFEACVCKKQKKECKYLTDGVSCGYDARNDDALGRVG